MVCNTLGKEKRQKFEGKGRVKKRKRDSKKEKKIK